MIEKKIQIMELLSEISDPFLQFFDVDSDEMLDEKIEVLKALKEGKSISEIPNFYDILELYPPDDVMWD